MKLKTIATLFAKNKHLMLINDNDGQQWVSNGFAIYKLQGLPKMSTDNVLRIFDIPPEKQPQWLCSESDEFENLSLADSYDGDLEVDQHPLKVEWYDGDKFWNFYHEGRIYAINEKYIKPLMDEAGGITFWKRETKSGAFCLAVRNGFMVIAIIMPARLHQDEVFVSTIRQVASGYAIMAMEDIRDAALELFKNQQDGEDA